MERNHLKLLLIDDTPSHRPSLGAVIREGLPGILLMTAGNGQMGLKLAEVGDPDMVRLNSAKSDRDGIDICRRLRTDG
ncbi:MAG: hypothetical protein Q7U02_09860, partial [Desulfosalsimonadaceae bacterium]|nr:hypothetical protein [Desulfosalsimonadaceae bacterium]